MGNVCEPTSTRPVMAGVASSHSNTGNEGKGGPPHPHTGPSAGTLNGASKNNEDHHGKSEVTGEAQKKEENLQIDSRIAVDRTVNKVSSPQIQPPERVRTVNRNVATEIKPKLERSTPQTLTEPALQCGAGIVLSNAEPFVIVVTTIEGKVKRGDIVIAMDGKSVKGMQKDDVRSLMIGAEGSSLSLEILSDTPTSDPVQQSSTPISVPLYSHFPDHIHHQKITIFRRRFAGSTPTSPFLTRTVPPKIAANGQSGPIQSIWA